MKALLIFLGLMVLVTPAGYGQTPAKPHVKEAREVVQELAAGQFAKVYARFDKQMREALPEARLAKVWNGLGAKVGKFKRIDAVKVVNGGATVVLTCQFERTKLNTLLTFNVSGQLAGMYFRPAAKTAAWTRPSYAQSADFTEKAMTVTTGRWKLPGTLTMPEGKGPFPGVVLVQGSGPLDRDETVGPNKPFKDLAWGLASRGVAVLRYDKRTYVYGMKSSVNPDRLTIDDVTVDDARSAVRLLVREPGIERHGIFVLGHSLGAVMAPRIATGDRTVAGIILLAGAITPIERLALEQVRTIDAREHVPEKEVQQRLAAAENW